MRLMLWFLVALLSLGVGLAENLSVQEIERHLENKNTFFLDVREPKEIKEIGSLPGYVNIPLSQLENRLSEIPKDKLVVTLCNRGVRASKAADLLKKNDYKVVGTCGMTDYKQKGGTKVTYPKD